MRQRAELAGSGGWSARMARVVRLQSLTPGRFPGSARLATNPLADMATNREAIVSGLT